MKLMLLSIVCIVCITGSVHATTEIDPLFVLSKVQELHELPAAQPKREFHVEQKFRHSLKLPTFAMHEQQRLLQNGTNAPTPVPEQGQCDSFRNDSPLQFVNATCTCEEGKFVFSLFGGQVWLSLSTHFVGL
jgi:hypothetical protein